MTREQLQSRKQQLVKDAIYEAAIVLFAERGFDETTVEEIAQAAGISRRSFFRYYETKDDLLAQSVLNYGAALTESIANSEPDLTPFELLHETVNAGIKYTASTHVTRETIEIAQRSASARRAYASRMANVEDSLAVAYAHRFKGANKDGLKPRLMAHLTHSLLSASIAAWFAGESKDLTSSTKQAFDCLASLVCNPEVRAKKDSSSKARSLSQAGTQRPKR